jgi:hypothetical protein
MVEAIAATGPEERGAAAAAAATAAGLHDGSGGGMVARAEGAASGNGGRDRGRAGQDLLVGEELVRTVLLLSTR